MDLSAFVDKLLVQARMPLTCFVENRVARRT
jgi:hypothetical protein